MRIGFCSNANFAFGNKDSIKRLEAIAKSGFDYIETQIAPLVNLTDSEFRKLVNHLQDINLPCRANLLLFPGDAALVGENVDIPYLTDFAEKAIERAVQMGSETIVFGHGGTRSYKNGITKEEAYKSLLMILRMVNGIAAKNGIKVAIEALNSKETNMLVYYRDVIQMVKDVNGQAVGGLCDWYHAWKDNQSPDEMKLLPEKLYHLHIAYPDGRKVPSMSDELEIYRPFFNTVKDMGYNDKISIEAAIPNLEDYYPVIREGLSAMKKILGYYELL